MIEKQNIEWKESWRDEYFKWICGYANAQGGKLFIGVDVMVRACRKYGSPEPVLRYEDSGFWVEFSGKTQGKTPDMILAALRQDPTLSMPEIAGRIGKSESAIERAIRMLREAGKLERIGPVKVGSWNVLDDN